MRIRSQFVRRSAAVVAGLALAGSAAALGSLQASAAPSSVQAVQAAATVAAAPTISIKADRATAKAWSKVSFTGKTTGIAASTKVQVQRLENGKWVTFPATTKVTSKATYSVWVQSGRVGVNKFRVVTSKAASSAVSITIVK
ncbi:hypothetical protein Kfla_1797 [Kribbella flavida DSM 17836]|uniref:Uncharacterized protein n=1 Tax=Kribbella flavida (strain DSM 17836 / JCM 10339 / NBRC 14399) TaxID=479435 RepID=D2PNN9_KRIFD|nr:hypothetical protein [Kribbella flavida]ADB30891.1 hypothetical protein Kfla_1797 [Kribbella flavida DSM 17836]